MSKRTHSLVKILLTLCFSICLVACIFSMNFASAATAPSIKDGASIRYDDKACIRFSAYVPDEYFADTDEHVLNDGITVGMEISLSPFEESTDIKTVNPTAWKTKSDKKGHQQYNVVIYNIPETDYATSIYARAFISGAEIVEGEDTTYTATVVRSIREVANATLAGDLLVDSEDVDNKLTTNQIQALEGYVSEDAAVLGDVTVKIRGGYAVWEAVENATTYLVKTESGTFKTTETKFLLDGDREVSVVAYGDGTTATYSNVSSKTARELGEMELATFNDDSYIEDLEAGNHTIGNYNNSATTGAEYHTATYSNYFYKGSGSSQTESTPVISVGTAEFGTAVTSTRSGTIRLSYFSVYLQKAIAFDYAGIKVRIKFEKYSGTAIDNGALTLRLADPTPDTNSMKWTKSQAYLAGYYHEGNDGDIFNGAETVVTAGEWIEWYIPNDKLDIFYNVGDYKLVFVLAATNGWQNTQRRTANFVLDDISYYGVGTPTNVVLSDEKVLSWDAVDGATGYVIDVNGETIETTATSYDLSANLTVDAEIKVKAVNDSDSSEYSEVVYYYAPSGFPMTFKDDTYINRVLVGDEGDIKTYSKDSNMSIPSGFIYTKEYVSSVEGAEDGALRILPVVARYKSWSTSARLAIFTIVLPEELNTDTTDGNLGVSVRIKLGDIVAGGETAYSGSQASGYYLCLVSNGETISDSNYRMNNNQLVTNGIPYLEVTDKDTFVTWNLDFATLLARGYNNGATEITFGILTETAVSSGKGYCIETWLDELAYYKETPV